MHSRYCSWLAGLVLALACFVGSFLATVTVAGAALGPSDPSSSSD